jgi:hypothetical protein
MIVLQETAKKQQANKHLVLFQELKYIVLCFYVMTKTIQKWK